VAEVKGGLLAATLLWSLATAASAQQAPVFLEPGHWSYDAIRRLHVTGAAPALSDPAAAPMTLLHARRVLEQAAAASDSAGVDGAARHWLRLLDAEVDSTGRARPLRLDAGWGLQRGAARAGDGYFHDEDWEGARPQPDVSGPAVLVTARVHAGRRLAMALQAGRAAKEWKVVAATVAVSAGPFDAWAGRRRLHYGAGRGGGTVLGTGMDALPELTHRTQYSLDGAGIHTREPFPFPRPLHFLGVARIEAAGGRLPRNGVVEAPFVAFGRFLFTPFTPRLTLGVNRGAIFGGDGNPVTAGRLAGLLIGLHGGEGGEFENQVFSVVARARPPLGSLPLELYLEWGMDDTAGAISDMPAIIGGIDLGAVPGVPVLALGVEAARYPVSCCGNPIWYRSVFFRGSWADEGRIFAHPLGGHGSELLGHLRLDLPELGLLARVQAFTRFRGDENLYSPGRTGRSGGVGADVEYHFRRGTGVRLSGGFEDGRGWSSHHALVSLIYSFHRTGP
jgi:hypothetical protein